MPVLFRLLRNYVIIIVVCLITPAAGVVIYRYIILKPDRQKIAIDSKDEKNEVKKEKENKQLNENNQVKPKNNNPNGSSAQTIILYSAIIAVLVLHVLVFSLAFWFCKY